MRDAIIIFFLATTSFMFFWHTFSNIGYINRRLLLNCSNKKKVNVKKLKKIIYIPHDGAKDRGIETRFYDKPKFDGYVYKITLMLSLINYAILFSQIVLCVLELMIGTLFLRILHFICFIISVCYLVALRYYAESLY